MRVGLLPDGRPVRAGTPLVTESGDSVGVVTSGGFGPTIDAPIALGLIDVSYAEVDIFAEQRGKRVAMSRASLPFVSHHYKRV